MVRKILRLWALYARMDLFWLFKDCRNFIICTAADAIVQISSITGIWLISEKFMGIGGLGRAQVLFMLGFSLTVSGITDAFFSFNVYHISRRIGRGQMDHVLVMPQPVWMTLLTEGFIPASGSLALISGIVILAYSVKAIGCVLSPGFLAMTAAALVMSAAISLLYSFLWGSLAFYSPVAAEEVSSSVNNFFSDLRNFPLDGLGKTALYSMLSILPAGLYAWYPSVSIISGNGARSILVLLCITAAYFIIVSVVFRKGMKHYVSKGTCRYLARGHRR